MGCRAVPKRPSLDDYVGLHQGFAMKPRYVIGDEDGLPLTAGQYMLVREMIEREVAKLEADLADERAARIEANDRLRAEMLLAMPNLIGRKPPDGSVTIKQAADPDRLQRGCSQKRPSS